MSRVETIGTATLTEGASMIAPCLHDLARQVRLICPRCGYRIGPGSQRYARCDIPEPGKLETADCPQK